MSHNYAKWQLPETKEANLLANQLGCKPLDTKFLWLLAPGYRQRSALSNFAKVGPNTALGLVRIQTSSPIVAP
jgi:hypothetical protein